MSLFGGKKHQSHCHGDKISIYSPDCGQNKYFTHFVGSTYRLYAGWWCATSPTGCPINKLSAFLIRFLSIQTLLKAGIFTNWKLTFVGMIPVLSHFCLINSNFCDCFYSFILFFLFFNVFTFQCFFSLFLFSYFFFYSNHMTPFPPSPLTTPLNTPFTYCSCTDTHSSFWSRTWSMLQIQGFDIFLIPVCCNNQISDLY